MCSVIGNIMVSIPPMTARAAGGCLSSVANIHVCGPAAGALHGSMVRFRLGPMRPVARGGRRPVVRRSRPGEECPAIVVVQWRAECLSYLGHPCLRTPNLDALGADGVTFRNHFTQAV